MLRQIARWLIEGVAAIAILFSAYTIAKPGHSAYTVPGGPGELVVADKDGVVVGRIYAEAGRVKFAAKDGAARRVVDLTDLATRFGKKE